MRSYICVSYENLLHKLVWMNEDNSGVYIGWYGEIAGSHVSYHADGTTHFRSSAFPEAVNQHKGPPIQDIDPFIQIGFQAIPLYQRMMGIIGHEYKKEDGLSSQAFFLNGTLFRHEVINLDLYILHRKKEQEFIQNVFTNRIDNLHLCAISSLDHFPSHKVAMIILQSDQK